MFRYSLEPYRGPGSRYVCPNCSHQRKTFTRYIYTQSGYHIAEHVGKCDRLDQCGYHYPPREFFKANPGNTPLNNSPVKKLPQPEHFDTLPESMVTSTMRSYDKNNFTIFLAAMFGAEAAIYLIEKYRIGCARHWPGATVFWQIDNEDKVRTGKIMLYNSKDCRRVKVPFNHIAWAHKLMGTRTQDFSLKQCLFGEHLLKLDPFKTVAITESEKTAVIASMYLPNYIWLAAGSMEGLNIEKCRVLKGRIVRLFPDVNAYAKWHTKARELNRRIPSATFITDNTLTQNPSAYDRERGVDIADKWIDSKLLEWELGSK